MFDSLFPDDIFAAISSQGYYPTGVLYPLNSFENRVYEIHVEDHPPLIAKFYRPGRWNEETIGEEHAFLKRCLDAEVPVIAPFDLKKHGKFSTLGKWNDFLFAIFPKFRGRAHDETTNDDRRWLGRALGRLHNVGENFKAKHRIELNVDTYGYEQLNAILKQKHLPQDLKPNLETLLNMALKLADGIFKSVPSKKIALHGDCHPANVLWNKIAVRSAHGIGSAGDADPGPMLIDFDDMVQAQPIQDLWMLFYGDDDEQMKQRESFFEGYEIFRTFDYSTLRLIEPLRTLRLIRHTAWIGARFEEQIFKQAFPYYSDRKYWEGFQQDIRLQISLMQNNI